MTRINRTLPVGRIFLLTVILALGVVGGMQTAAACSGTSERYPMLIGSGYEGESCDFVVTSCPDTAERYPMLIGSGYEGESCDLVSADRPLESVARTTSPTWRATMLDGSGYERAVIEAALSGPDRE